jgi:hypothetical protein
MDFLHSLAVRLSLSGLLLASLCGSAFAAGLHERTQFGHDISVGADEEVAEVTCFGCNVHIRGKVQGDANVFGGSILVEDQGQVAGDTTSFGGDIRLDKGSETGGDVTVFAGRLHRDPSATVHGDVTAFSGSLWLVLIFGLPLVLLGAFIALIVWIIWRLTHPAMPVTA